MKPGASVYAKKNKSTNWVCICLDRNQLLAKNVHQYRFVDLLIHRKSIPLPLDKEVSYLNQYTASARILQQSKDVVNTMSPLPIIKRLDPSTPLSISFIPDSVMMNLVN